MKSSFGKLKRLVQKNDEKNKKDNFLPNLQPDHLALASQEMQDMRNCYDTLLEAAAATTNSAYEFSESLREMGGCLQEKAELYKDDESKNIFMMLGNVQFELQKLVDLYRSHVFLTITKPSESHLEELQTVQEMKQQCDEKRSVYEYMIAQQREKGRSKNGKGEGFSLEQLQQAHTEYEEEAILCVFRLKSLKQNQSGSLLTQAARHHTAQLNFFRKGHKSLEAVDTHVKLITEKQHINYQLSEFEDGGGEDETEYSYDSNYNGDISLDYYPQKVETEAAVTSRNSMELDQEVQPFPKASSGDNTELNQEKIHVDSQMLESEPGVSNYSHSAPIFPEKKFDPAERARQMRPSLTQKFHTYVLPTPKDAKSSNSSRTSSVPRTRPSSVSTHNISFSSPLESKVNKRDAKEDNQSLSFYEGRPLVDERDNSHDNLAPSLLPPSLADGVAYRQSDSVDISEHKKLKRQSFSGPISSNSRPMKPGISSSGPIPSSKPPQQAAVSTSQAMLPQPSSSKTSCHSPPSVSPPKISELHELPRPPGVVSSKATMSTSSGQSGPLGSRNLDRTVDHKGVSIASKTASPLPTPPLTFPRSLSMPSNHSNAKALKVTKFSDSPQLQNKDISSPPLMPIALADAHAVISSPRAGSQASGT